MNHHADASFIRWLMLPAVNADRRHLPGGATVDCIRALRMSSVRLHKTSVGPYLLQGDSAFLMEWLRQDSIRLRRDIYLAGAWMFGERLRMHVGQAIMHALVLLIGKDSLLAIMRSEEQGEKASLPLRNIGQVFAVGGALMYDYCRQRLPLLAQRLLLRFSPAETATWFDVSAPCDYAAHKRIAERVVFAKMGAHEQAYI